MKKKLLVILSNILLLTSLQLVAQTPWLVGGNTLTANSRFGSNNGFAVIFRTNSFDRGVITTSGLWGIGTTLPENTLHVVKGSAGVVTGYFNAPLIVENSTNSYINILAPTLNETGILFGNPSSSLHGGIIYNNPSLGNGLQFRTNGNVTRMALSNSGNLGIGTTIPSARLHIEGGTDAGISGGGYIILGSLSGLNIALDNNEIMARNNGATSELALNAEGGNIDLSAHSLFVQGANKNVGIGTVNPAVRLHVDGGSDANLGGGGYILTNSAAGENVVIDENEIMARNNGAISPLYLNFEGGNVIIGQTSTESKIGIGTSAPSANIHMAYATGTSNHGLILDNTSSAGVDWKIYAASTDELWLQNDDITVGTFNGISGVYTPSSDRKLKKEIAIMENVLEKVMQLKPSLYHFNTQKNSSDRKFIGLIAQEVQPIFPEAVYEHNGKNDGTDDFLTLDYSTFGIIAIKAIQEQQQKITTLEERIAKLEAALTKVNIANKESTQNASAKNINAFLEQNVPNPFNQVTTIRYKIPAGATGQITIYDQSGKLVKTLSATESGLSQINANELRAGTYTYSLSVNGRLIESKKMIMVK
jgi:hypothetical protein